MGDRRVSIEVYLKRCWVSWVSALTPWTQHLSLSHGSWIGDARGQTPVGPQMSPWTSREYVILVDLSAAGETKLGSAWSELQVHNGLTDVVGSGCSRPFLHLLVNQGLGEQPSLLLAASLPLEIAGRLAVGILVLNMEQVR